MLEGMDHSVLSSKDALMAHKAGMRWALGASFGKGVDLYDSVATGWPARNVQDIEDDKRFGAIVAPDDRFKRGVITGSRSRPREAFAAATWRVHPHKPTVGELRNVAVLPGYGGRGFATAMLEEILSEMKARGCTRVIADSRPHHLAANRWLLSEGFDIVGKTSLYDPNQQDLTWHLPLTGKRRQKASTRQAEQIAFCLAGGRIPIEVSAGDRDLIDLWTQLGAEEGRALAHRAGDNLLPPSAGQLPASTGRALEFALL
jgi:ribosomal protein S18 acetylase RimI-like enzyme